MTDEKLYGVHPVLEALQEERRHIRQVLISAQRRGAEVQRILALAKRRGIPMLTLWYTPCAMLCSVRWPSVT